MLRLFLYICLPLLLSGEMVNSIKVLVQQEPITLFDIQEQMQKASQSEQDATEVLVRKKLESQEIKSKGITATTSEIFDELKRQARANNLSVDELYAEVSRSMGLSSDEYKEHLREQILLQKLYSEISYSSMYEPRDDELREYYKLHKEKFNSPLYYDVIIYSASSADLLDRITKNPMFHSNDLSRSEQRIYSDRATPELLNLLASTQINRFTPIVATSENSFSTFYLRGVDQSNKDGSFETQKERIANEMLADKREQVLSDYFARLKDRADIRYNR